MKVDGSGHTHPIPHSRVPDINTQQLGKSGSSNVGNFERSYLIKTLMEKEESVGSYLEKLHLKFFRLWPLFSHEIPVNISHLD